MLSSICLQEEADGDGEGEEEEEEEEEEDQDDVSLAERLRAARRHTVARGKVGGICKKKNSLLTHLID